MNYHGTSLVFNKQGILLRGQSGAGKSDLALRLIHQGAILIADDQTEIVAKGADLMASCPKALEGKLEVRGIGIINVPFIRQHPLHLVIDLSHWQKIDRFPEKKDQEIEGITRPVHELDPFELSIIDKIKILTLL